MKLSAIRTACVAVGLAAAGIAHADDCGAGPTAPVDPVGLPWRDTGLDAGRGACPRPGVSAMLGGHALIDTPAFYGTLAGDLALTLRLTYRGVEWSVAVRAPTVTFVQNA